MRFYNAKVRLAGSLLHEVYKEGLSAPEIMLLRHIHGQDAVVDIKYVDEKTYGPDENAVERDRLRLIYDDVTPNQEARNSKVEELFGPPHRELPQTAPRAPTTREKSLSDLAA